MLQYSYISIKLNLREINCSSQLDKANPWTSHKYDGQKSPWLPLASSILSKFYKRYIFPGPHIGKMVNGYFSNNYSPTILVDKESMGNTLDCIMAKTITRG